MAETNTFVDLIVFKQLSQLSKGSINNSPPIQLLRYSMTMIDLITTLIMITIFRVALFNLLEPSSPTQLYVDKV